MNSFFRKTTILTLALLLTFPLQAVFGISFLNVVEAETITLPSWDTTPNNTNSSYPTRVSGPPTAIVTIPQQQAETATAEQNGSVGTATGGTPSGSYSTTGSGAENNFGNSNTASPTSGAGGSEAVSEALSCSVASIMATIFSGALSALGGAVSQILPDTEVPVKDSTQRAKETGPTIFGIPILPSWDAIAYCLGNLIVAYIGQTAVEWANTGFGGNPAFITDPSQFFQAIADIETENFLYELSGSSVCSPYTQQIQRDIAIDSISGFNDKASCSFRGGNGSELNSFFSNSSAPSIFDFAQMSLPQNTYWGARELARSELSSRISSQSGEQEFLLNIGRGFFSQRGENGLIDVIGSIIADQLSYRLNLPLDRAAAAQGINQVITTLLNAVFKAALGDIFNSNS